jgi:hypothetical protein
MPGTDWPVTGYPPDSSWNLVLAPVSMPPKTSFDTSTAIRLRSPSRSPPDASCAPFPTRSRQRSSANAAVGGLAPLPEERRRRATTFIFHAATHRSRSPTYIRDLSLCARGTHTILVLAGCNRNPTCSILSTAPPEPDGPGVRSRCFHGLTQEAARGGYTVREQPIACEHRGRITTYGRPVCRSAGVDALVDVFGHHDHRDVGGGRRDFGNDEASTTRNPLTPLTAPTASTTAQGSPSPPIGAVDVGWP